MPKQKQRSSKPAVPSEAYTPTPDDRRLAERQLKRIRRSRRAPKVDLTHEVGKPIEIRPGHPDPKIGNIGLYDAFGTTEAAFAIQQLLALINATHADQAIPVEQDVVNAGLAAISGINPADEIEAMLATQMVASNHAAMDLLRRAGQTDYVNKTNIYGNLAIKFLRTFTTQLEALQRYRGKGQQKIVVERVNVSDGGQAIVGAVEQGPARGDIQEN